MPRPIRNNAEYFTHSANFRNDRRVKAIRTQFGAAGYGLLMMVYEVLTDTDYTCLDVSETELELLAGDFGVSVTEINSLLQAAERVGIFRRNEAGKLHSVDLDTWLESVFTKRNRSRNVSELAKPPVSVTEIPSNGVSVTETTQSKVKKSKEEKSKEKEGENGLENERGSGADAPAPPLLQTPVLTFKPSENASTQKPPQVAAAPPKPRASLEERREVFKDQLRDYYRHHPDKYAADMYTAFINYWSESDGKKMRWEKESAFELPNRLATWHSRDTQANAANKPYKSLTINGSQPAKRDGRREPVPGTPFGKL